MRKGKRKAVDTLDDLDLVLREYCDTTATEHDLSIPVPTPETLQEYLRQHNICIDQHDLAERGDTTCESGKISRQWKPTHLSAMPNIIVDGWFGHKFTRKRICSHLYNRATQVV